MPTIRRLNAADGRRLRQFWKERWGGEEMVVHGVIFHPQQLDGFVAENDREWLGLATFIISGQDCEIISLDSLRPRQGIGSALIEKVTQTARQAGCRRVCLMTTNDNLYALGFYQKRGFELVAVHRGAVDRARTIKPGIPRIGENGILLRDEIELEMIL